MSSRVFGEWFATADMTGTPRVFSKITFNSNTVLLAVRAWFIFYNDPAFTAISMRIYSNNGGSPGALLHTSSNSLTKAEILSMNNGDRELYFEFLTKPTFDGDDSYLFVPHITGYTGTASSHVAWKKAVDSPVYTTGLSTTFPTLLTRPYTLSLIGSAY